MLVALLGSVILAAVVGHKNEQVAESNRQLESTNGELARERDRTLTSLRDTKEISDALKKVSIGLLNATVDKRRIVIKPDAEKQALLLIEALEKAVKADPADAEANRNLSDSYYLLGTVYRDKKSHDKMKAAWLKAAKISEPYARDHPDHWQAAANAGRTYYNLGVAAAERDAQQEVIDHQSQAVAWLEPLLKSPGASRVRWFVCWAHVGRGTARLKLSQPREALPDWERAGELADRQDREPIRLHGLAYTLARLAEHQKAAAAAEKALAGLPGSNEDYLVAAKVFALNSGTAGQPESERYALRSLECLRAASKRGAFKEPAAKAELTKRTGDFKALQARDDFQAFLRELKTNPTAWKDEKKNWPRCPVGV